MLALYNFNQNAVLKQNPCTPLRHKGRYLWPPSNVDCSSWKIVDGKDTIPMYRTMNVAIDEDMHVFRWSIHRYLARWNPTNKACLKDILRVQLSHRSQYYSISPGCISWRSVTCSARRSGAFLKGSDQITLDLGCWFPRFHLPLRHAWIRHPHCALGIHMDASLTGHRVTSWVQMPDLHSRTGGTKYTRKTSTLTPFTCLDWATWMASNTLCHWHRNLGRVPGKSWKKY